MELGDNKKYAIKGLGSTSWKLERGENIHLHNILYVQNLKNNLLSISYLEDKGDRVSFVYGKVFSRETIQLLKRKRLLEFMKEDYIEV